VGFAYFAPEGLYELEPKRKYKIVKNYIRQKDMSAESDRAEFM